MIANGDTSTEVWLKSQAVDGLLKMNKKKPDVQFDLVFLKALLIGCCSIKRIREDETIDDGLLALIKDLFEWRVQKLEDRMRSYENLLRSAIDDIRNNDFK